MNEVPGAWEMGSDSDSASNWTCLKDVMTGRFQHGGFNIQGHFFHLGDKYHRKWNKHGHL